MIPDGLDELLVQAGLGRCHEIAPIEGTVHSRQFRVEADGGSACLRVYDPVRYATEVAFLTYSNEAAPAFVPRVLATDRARSAALVELVEGTPIEPPHLEDGVPLERVLDFMAALDAQRGSPLARGVGSAPGAPTSIAGHIELVSRRVRRLAEVPEPAASFFAAEVQPRWAKVRRRLSELPDTPLGPDDLVISPVDIGLHNAVLLPDWRVRYLEFGLAGWDDPAAVVNDLFSSLAVPVPERFYEEWTRLFLYRRRDPEAAFRRVEALRPLFQIKWICVVFDEFLGSNDPELQQHLMSFASDAVARFARNLK